MRRALFPLLLAFPFASAAVRAAAQMPASSASPGASSTASSTVAGESANPLPNTRDLLLDVERHQKAAEALRRDYTYHVHIEQQDFAKNGAIRKTTTTDAESLTLNGVRIDRVVARNGRPLTPEEAKKEDERIDKEVAKARERRGKEEDKGKETDSRGDVLIPASRILELGSFSNPRRVDLNGRPTIVLDYAGDPKAQTHGPAEGIIHDIVGTVWIDEGERVLVRGQGHFVNDFKIAGGLLANIHKGLSFDFEFQRVADGVWLPSVFDGQGSARILLFEGVNGHARFVTSDYRKFRTGVQIIPSNRVIGADGNIVPDTGTQSQPGAATPGTTAPSPQR